MQTTIIFSLIFILLILLFVQLSCSKNETFQWGMSGPFVVAYMQQAAAQTSPLDNMLYSFKE
jgi:hypothetical protein